jgi:hypothetical protein
MSTSPNTQAVVDSCPLSTTAYSIYSQLPCISGGRSSTRKLKNFHALIPGSPLSLVSEYINFMCLKAGGIYIYRCASETVRGSPSCIAISRVSVQLQPSLIFRSYRSSNERGLINQVARRRNRNKHHRTVDNFKCARNVGYPVENYV